MQRRTKHWTDGLEAQVAALLAAAGAQSGAAVVEAEDALVLKVRCWEEIMRNDSKG